MARGRELYAGPGLERAELDARREWVYFTTGTVRTFGCTIQPTGESSVLFLRKGLIADARW